MRDTNTVDADKLRFDEQLRVKTYSFCRQRSLSGAGLHESQPTGLKRRPQAEIVPVLSEALEIKGAKNQTRVDNKFKSCNNSIHIP